MSLTSINLLQIFWVWGINWITMHKISQNKQFLQFFIWLKSPLFSSTTHATIYPDITHSLCQKALKHAVPDSKIVNTLELVLPRNHVVARQRYTATVRSSRTRAETQLTLHIYIAQGKVFSIFTCWCSNIGVFIARPGRKFRRTFG